MTINAPLHPETRGFFTDQLLGTMRRDEYLTANGGRLVGTGAHSYSAGQPAK